MKKLFILFFLALPSMASAQILVNSDGNVGIGITESPHSQVAIGDKGTTSTTIQVDTEKSTGLYMRQRPHASSHFPRMSLLLSNVADSIGWRGVYMNHIVTYSPFSIGMQASIRNQRGYNNAGVFANLGYETKGAAIFGGLSASLNTMEDGRYAGYFYGNVKVSNGTLNATLVTDSDEGLKENIVQMDQQNSSVLADLSCLNPVTYNYKLREKKIVLTDEDMGITDIAADDPEMAELLKDKQVEEEPSQVMTKTHFGFIAQELQQVYPELVYENDNGTLSVCYVELIPILVQSIKELNAKVEALQETNGYAKANLDDDVTAIDSPLTDAGTGVASMSQNMPNPFTDKTDIPIYLPESVKTATLCIYDLTGKQIEQYVITGRGQTTMTIHADRMAAGMYLYALIADGKVVTSKRMIVSK